jgi:nitroreductase
MFMDIANKRRSVRKYLDKPVEKEKIAMCLEAARLAPSACNSQPWKFIVVDNPVLKDAVCDAVFSGAYRTNMFAKKAPVLVAVVSDKGNFIAKVGGFLRDTRYYLIDIGIAAEHFMLQAAELGLGTCCLGWFSEKEAKKELSVPAGNRVDLFISVGYPEGQDEAGKIRKHMSEIASYNPE